MKINQDPKFQPITLTLESNREAEMLWQAVRLYANDHAKGPVEIAFYTGLSNWFTTEAQL